MCFRESVNCQGLTAALYQFFYNLLPTTGSYITTLVLLTLPGQMPNPVATFSSCSDASLQAETGPGCQGVGRCQARLFIQALSQPSLTPFLGVKLQRMPLGVKPDPSHKTLPVAGHLLSL